MVNLWCGASYDMFRSPFSPLQTKGKVLKVKGMYFVGNILHPNYGLRQFLIDNRGTNSKFPVATYGSPENGNTVWAET